VSRGRGNPPILFMHLHTSSRLTITSLKQVLAKVLPALALALITDCFIHMHIHFTFTMTDIQHFQPTQQ